jgi:hypothetical protein
MYKRNKHSVKGHMGLMGFRPKERLLHGISIETNYYDEIRNNLLALGNAYDDKRKKPHNNFGG